MHILFVHQNYPAQFGQIARHLVANQGYRCTFISRLAPANRDGVECIQYDLKGGAREATHYCSRTFENAVWHAHGVFEALKTRPELAPDLVVGHSGFGSTLFLRELYDCPIINYFEYFYQAENSDMDFRPDFPSTQLNRLRARARNAMLLLDLDNCQLAYSPTHWQRNRFPESLRDKIQVIFDGIDTNVWRPQPDPPPLPSGFQPPAGAKLVTYVSRGMESMRGFDIFMKTAKLLCDRRRDVHFAVVGEDRICYGGDDKVIGQPSFKQWVLSQDNYDLSRFSFLGYLPAPQLANLLCRSQLHIYLTVPFVLSWSVFNALACGAIVLASDTEPVKEVIEHDRNGLLCDFFDVEKMADMAEHVLDNQPAYARHRAAAVDTIQQSYSLDRCLPRLRQLYESVVSNNCAS